MYNITNITEANNIYEQFVAVNQLSSGLFAVLILWVLAIIILMVFKNRYQMEQILIGDGFICSFLAIFMFASGIISWGVFILPALIFMAALITHFLTRD